MTSQNAADLASRLEAASSALLVVLGAVPEAAWAGVPRPGTWSIGKEAEHVAEAATSHQWIVRLTIGEAVPSRRPTIERARLTTALSPADAIELIRQRTEEGVVLLRGLTDAQLDLPTRPPRARDERLAATIERVLIGHYDAHRRDIEAKLR